MDSYERRLKTFENKNWFGKRKAYTPETLAICGFYTEKKFSSMAVKCYYCKKVLEGWDDDEVPIIEHFSHKKTCILFKPNVIKSRRDLFGNEAAYEELAKIGFIKFNILQDKPFIFCYKCGSQDKKHICKIKTTWKFDPKEKSEFFFANLISGRLQGMISDMLNDKLEISEKAREVLEPLIDEMEKCDPSQTLGEFITSYCTTKLNLVRDKMEANLKNE
jgi:hypothetical protein